MSTRQDYITAVSALVSGELPLGEPEKIFAIGKAVKKYSADKPRPVVEDVAGDGGFDYLLTLLSYWSDGFSTVKTVEYPVDDSVETPGVLEEDSWSIYLKPAGRYLRFLDAKPAATEHFRVMYTAPHVCDDVQCTIPEADEAAVQALAAAEFCDMLATYYAQTGDSTIQADSVDHKSRSSEYAARARTYRKSYSDHLGIVPGSVPAASVTRDQDAWPSWRRDHLTHGRKFR